MIKFYKITLLCGPISFFYQAIGASSTINLYIITCIFILNHLWVFTSVKIFKYFLIHNLFLLDVRAGYPLQFLALLWDSAPILDTRNKVAINLRSAQGENTFSFNLYEIAKIGSFA